MTKKTIITVLTYGAIWGIFEATLGYLLHWLPVLISGTILFPIASVILLKVYNQTRSNRALLYTAFIAASFKSINFLLPNISTFKVLNPMVSIVLEAVFVMAVVYVIQKDSIAQKATGFLAASVLWRGAFVLYMYVQFSLTGNLAPYISTFTLVTSFILLEGLVSAVIAIALYYLVETSNSYLKIQIPSRFSTAFLLTIIAILTTYYL